MKRTRCAADVAHTEDEKCIQKFGWETQRKKEHFEDLGMDGMITLNWMLQRYQVEECFQML
jgi:hypothetical protein